MVARRVEGETVVASVPVILMLILGLVLGVGLNACGTTTGSARPSPSPGSSGPSTPAPGSPGSSDGAVALPDAPLPKPVSPGEAITVQGDTVVYRGTRAVRRGYVAVFDAGGSDLRGPGPLVVPTGDAVALRPRGSRLVSQPYGQPGSPPAPDALYAWRLHDTVVQIRVGHLLD